jgi:alpha-L-arabinofuranosidase
MHGTLLQKIYLRIAISACGATWLLACCTPPSCVAQNAVTVQVNVDKPINAMTLDGMGVYTDMWDAGTIRPIIVQYLHAAGIHSLSYPGGYQGYADLYHWTTNSGTRYQNYSPSKERYYAPENSMGHMVPFIDQVGTALITVNYGSNLAGTGGGEPAEAAAWVAYANGDPADDKPLGKDSTGQDWKTVGYWAKLRGEEPIANDDGLNLLRAGHPKPLGIKLWQVGNEVYNNGYYGGDHKDEEDLHAPYPPSDKENEKRRKNPNLSPAYYGDRVVEYSKAMKAVDPTIWIGASLNLAPGDYSWGPDWNANVLKAACGSIDFIGLVWRPGGELAPDYQTLDMDFTLMEPQNKLGAILSEVIYNNKKYCPAGHSPRVAFTQMATVHWPKVQRPIVNTLFAADTFALLAESGTLTSDWVEMHDSTLLTKANQPGPGYFGMQMLHIVAFHPGDQFVSATSSSPAIAVHATHRIDGGVGLMIVNKDEKSAAQIKVTLAGGTVSVQGLRFDCNEDVLKAGNQVVRSSIKVDGSTFNLNVPPFSVTDVILTK